MKKKLLVTAIAGAMVAPSAFAAQDNQGMQYTSASEGFYASIRARYTSGDNENDISDIGNSGSRFGVQGSTDLGGGMSGFYRYEAGVGIDDGSGLSTRLGHVGLRGAFGEVAVGTMWSNGYNWVYGSTDVANDGVTGAAIGNRNLNPLRISNAIQYTSPDFNGFQASGFMQMNGGSTEDNDVDQYMLVAKYGIQGFTGAFAYSVVSDGLPEQNFTGSGTSSTLVTSNDDHTGWAAKLGYAQDNWYVNTWYGVDNTGDTSVVTGAGTSSVARNSKEDVKSFSIAGGVSVGKVDLYAGYNNQENEGGTDGRDDTTGTVGVQYNLGLRSRVWVEYSSQDKDSAPTADDYVTIGLRHDF